MWCSWGCHLESGFSEDKGSNSYFYSKEDGGFQRILNCAILVEAVMRSVAMVMGWNCIDIYSIVFSKWFGSCLSFSSPLF